MTDAMMVTELKGMNELLEIIEDERFWKIAFVDEYVEKLATATVFENEDDGIGTMNDVQ